MQIIKKDLKAREVIVKIENPEDFWYLNKIIETNDIIQGKTTRKIKIEQSTDRKSSSIKKIIYVKIEVEKLEFHEFSNNLRISGKTLEGSDDVSKGAYHTFDLEENSVITIIKPRWLNYHLKILEDSKKNYIPKILICILDREECCFALLKSNSYEYLLELEGDVERKQYQSGTKSNFYKEISKQLQEYVKRYNIEKIIVGSPSFWKEYLVKELPKFLQSKVIPATCNHVGKQGINELLRRTELQKVLADERTAQESQLVEDLLFNISQNKKAAYGIKEVTEKAKSGAIATLLITDKFIKESRQNNKSLEVDRILDLTESFKGEIYIISSSQEPGRKLDSLTGIASILRY